MTTELENIKTLVSGFLGGAVIAVPLAWLAFKLLSEKWLDNKFSKNLEEFKHQKNTEISKLKIEIDSLLSNKIRNQNKEFEVLEALWPKISNLHSCAFSVFFGGLPFENYSNLKGKYLSEALINTGISNTFAKSIVISKNPKEEYEEAIYRKKWLHIIKQVKKSLTRSTSLAFLSQIKQL